MKARLAKKIAHTPTDKLSPYWYKKILNGDRRVQQAIKKTNNNILKNNNYENRTH